MKRLRLPQPYQPGDLSRKGFNFPPSTGEYNPAAKLTDEQVTELKSRKAAGESAKSLAKAFGIHWASVNRLCRNHRKPTPHLKP